MFLLIRCDDPNRLSILALDGTEPNAVGEVCLGATLADIANAIDAVAVAECRARHAARSAPVAPLAVADCVVRTN